MKKPGLFILILALVVGAFVAGLMFQRRSGNVGPVAAAQAPGPEQDSDSEEVPPDAAPGTIRISNERQQMIGVKTGVIRREPLNHTFRLLGRVATDETRIFVINTTVDGWIVKAQPNTTGSLVRKNEVLATFYSSVFLPAVQSLIYVESNLDRSSVLEPEQPGAKPQPDRYTTSLKQATDSLRNFGMGEAQIERIRKDLKWNNAVDLASPADGIVLARNVSDGLRFAPGDELYRIADLSRIWILADVFEREIQYFRPGTKATVLLPYQKKSYEATVSSVPPVFDASTRTLKVRLETANPGLDLRPDMFVDVELRASVPPGISVPANSVLFSGLRSIVFVDRGQGIFEPREVETGWRLGDRVEILKGLAEGERIALSGNFFIDSESRLQAVAQGIYGDSAVDPVCGTAVDKLKASESGLTSLFEGTTYYFCSQECKDRFDKAPGSFVETPRP